MRMFVALPPSLPAVEHLADFLEIMPPHAGHPRWVPAAGWHVTCAFLGEITPSQSDDMADALADIAAATQPIVLRLAGAGTFPSPLRPRVLYMAVEDPAEALPGLFRAIRKAARLLGVQFENRSQIPHLTIARGRLEPDSKWWARADLYEGPWWTASALHLMSSRPGAAAGGHPVYRSEQAFAFCPG